MSDIIKNKRTQYRVYLDSCVVDALRGVCQNPRSERGIDSQMINLLLWLGIVQLREIAQFGDISKKMNARKSRKQAVKSADSCNDDCDCNDEAEEDESE